MGHPIVSCRSRSGRAHDRGPGYLWTDRIGLSSILLAERAQVSDGKLYVMGGGFDCVRHTLPVGLDASLALILEVPWGLLETPYRVQLELADADGAVAGFRKGFELASSPPEHWRRGVPLPCPSSSRCAPSSTSPAVMR